MLVPFCEQLDCYTINQQAAFLESETDLSGQIKAKLK